MEPSGNPEASVVELRPSWTARTNLETLPVVVVVVVDCCCSIAEHGREVDGVCQLRVLQSDKRGQGGDGNFLRVVRGVLFVVCARAKEKKMMMLVEEDEDERQ